LQRTLKMSVDFLEPAGRVLDAAGPLLTSLDEPAWWLYTLSINRLIDMKTSPVPPRRERILTAAAALFAHNGVKATSIRDIAKRADANSQLIYHYFRDKRGLCQAVVGREAERIQALLQQAVDHTGSPRDRLVSFIRSWITITVNDAAAVRLVFQITQTGDARNLSFVKDRSFRNATLMRTLIREGIKSGDFRADLDPRFATATLAGMVFFLATSGDVLFAAVGLDREPHLAEKMAQHSAALFLHGISAPSRRARDLTKRRHGP
jgi:AcrR family transcriptional regulator